MLKSISCFITIAFAVASQTTGSFAAEAPWDRTVLPRPPQPFQGVTKRSLEGSVASFTQPVMAPANAPNVVLVGTKFRLTLVSTWSPGRATLLQYRNV